MLFRDGPIHHQLDLCMWQSSCLSPLNQAVGYQLVDGVDGLGGGQAPAGQLGGVGDAVRAGQQRQIDADRRIRDARLSG